MAIAGGLLAAVYVFRVLRQAFLVPPLGERRRAAHRAAPVLAWTAFVLAALSVLLGLRGMDLVRLLRVGS